jgi:putative ABC transport system substrate-binding protein
VHTTEISTIFTDKPAENSKSAGSQSTREFIAGLGSAAAWPLLADAQQQALPVIGYLSSNPEDVDVNVVAAFRRGLGEQGYLEGRNVEILYRREIQNDRLPELAADLVRRRVAVIFCGTTPASLAAKQATATISIVIAVGADPIQAGLVASLNRPAGNVTGTTYLVVELAPKRLELLHEIVPAAKSIGYLYNTNYVNDLEEIKALPAAAGTLGLRLVTAKVTTGSDIEGAFAMLVREGIGAVLIGTLVQWTKQIIALTAYHALPAMSAFPFVVQDGGLISYGGDGLDAIRVAGTYVGRILKGEKPANLPVQQSTRVEMVINLKTAKALGLTIPETLLATADEVIQ